jgi:DNA-binding SARP family transcriptional activator/tetratricopeptide (TPR) repeat protein
MEFRILGPLEVVDLGRPLDLGGHNQRVLLTALLIEGNRVVPTDRLIDVIWDERPPETARKALHVHVSKLRKLLGAGRLETVSSGYRLRVEEGELDSDVFLRLAEAGKNAEALAVWRGPALSDFAHERFAQAEIARLEEARLACIEQRIESDLADGRHAQLTGELEALVHEHPLRECLRAQLVLSLYRSGRQAEALEAYQAARTALVDELGIEPGRTLQDLQQAILNHDPSLDLPDEPAPAIELDRSAAGGPVRDGGRQREERKRVTAVFVGASISLASGETLDPEALRRTTDGVFAAVEAAIDRHGGTVESSSVDAITAVFGLPRVHEDDPVRAVRASVEIREALASLAAELREERGMTLRFQVGISTGEVVAGGAGGGRVRATGEPLQRASRLPAATASGEIALDEATRRVLGDAAVVEPASSDWRLERLADSATRPSRVASAMVGRERERRRLQDAFDQAVGDRSCQLFTVLGPAGVGKSRLVREFIGDLAGRASVASGRCLPYGDGITFWPLLEAVKEIVELEDTESAETGRASLHRLLALEPDGELAAARVADLIGLGEAAEVAGEDGFSAVRLLFEAVARTRPLVVVFDDIHWAEETFLALVEHLAVWSRDAPILLLCLARPELLELRPVWGGGLLNATTTLLEPLTETECSELVENLVGKSGPTGEIVSTIAGAAEGNPLFVEELLSMLIDDGALVRGEGGWTATADLSALRVPPTIQGLLAARLEQLAEDERSVIECAAVVGKVFFEDAVAELASDLEAAAIADALGSLVLKELVRPEQTVLGRRTYRFRHLLIRDAAYDAISKDARAGLHERFGRWLARATSDRPTEYQEVVGYHLEQAYRYRVELGAGDEAARVLGREAAERLADAGRRAFIRSDAPAGVNLVSRAVRMLPASDPLRVELVPNVRVVQGTGVDMSWADRVLTEAVEAAATTGDRRLAAHALVQRGLLRLFTAPEVTADELLATAERAIGVFEEFEDEVGLARAWRLHAQAHYLGRRAGACAESSERALEHARNSGGAFEEREILEWLVIALFLGPATVVAATTRCKALAEEAARNPLIGADVLVTLATFAAMEGRTDEADELMERGRAIMDASGRRTWIFSFNCALVYLWRGDAIAAEEEVRPLYEVLKRLGEKSHFSTHAQTLAEVLYAQGRFEEAEQMTLECEAASRPNDVHSQILWRSTRAKLLAQRGELEAGERLAREAVAYAETSDFRFSHAEALLDLGVVLRLAGEGPAAAEAIEEALRLHEQKGNLVGADSARDLLEELSRSG